MAELRARFGDVPGEDEQSDDDDDDESSDTSDDFAVGEARDVRADPADTGERSGAEQPGDYTHPEHWKDLTESDDGGGQTPGGEDEIHSVASMD